MPGKHNAGGCGCCCPPILERVDEFTSKWSCWRGGALITSYGFGTLPPESVFEFDTANGKLRKNHKSGVSSVDDWIAADADLLQLPFSMEYIIEIDSYLYDGGTIAPFVSLMGARFNSTGSVRGQVQYIPAVGASDDGLLTVSLIRGTNTTIGITYAEIPRNTGGYKIQYRMKFESTGITHWLWLNDALPTEATTSPFPNSTAFWGVEESYSLSGETEIDGSYWQFSAGSIIGSPDTDDLWVADRLEIRKWDHTETSFPDPDNPL